MGTTTWLESINGLEIEITNHYSLLRWESWEELRINNEVVARREGTMLLPASYLSHTREDSSSKTDIAVLVASQGFAPSYQVYIDGEHVAGSEQLNPAAIPPKEWETLEREGILRFLFSHGLVRFGLPYAVFMTLLSAVTAGYNYRVLPSFLFYALGFGLTMGYYKWWGLKKVYGNAIR